VLVESATNPRRRFNEENLRVAGARGLRAAKLAALDSVPVRVVALTDAQALLRQQLFVYRDLFPWLDHPFQPPPLLDPVAEQMPLSWSSNLDSRDANLNLQPVAQA
jgi:hypothetical protein